MCDPVCRSFFFFFFRNTQLAFVCFLRAAAGAAGFLLWRLRAAAGAVLERVLLQFGDLGVVAFGFCYLGSILLQWLVVRLKDQDRFGGGLGWDVFGQGSRRWFSCAESSHA